MEEICRLCCSTKFVNNHIFDEENALFIKMSLYLPIKLHKGDQLPQRVCDKCSCKVNDFYQFCNEAIEAQNRLKLLFAFEKKQPIDSIDLTIIKRDTNSPSLQCDKSTQTVEEKDNNLLPGLQIKEEPKQSNLSPVKEELADTDYIPDLDSDSTNSEDEVLSKIKINKQLNKHENKSKVNGITTIRKKRTKKQTDWTKGFAGKLLAENDVNIIQSDGQVNLNVVKHELYEVKPQDLGLDLNALDDIGQNVYYCCICFIQMENKIDMLNHYKVHVSKAELQKEPPPAPPLPDELPYRCTRCKKTVEKASSWAPHWKRHWARDHRPYRCTLCEKTFRDHKQIFKHGLTHKAGESRASGVQNRYVCDTCPEGFVYMKCLLAHRTRAHPEAASRPLQLRCTVCARVFAHINSLRRHQRSHTGERNHLCNVCGKALSSREHLKFHIRIHTGYKPNVCGVCGKGFVKKCNLTLHERVHSGEKPHVCSHCGKAFSQRSTLVIHERYHSGARPYVCSLCGRGFVAKGLLSMHLKTACVDHPPNLDKMSSRS